MDKLLHFAGYALLGGLFLRGFRNSKFKNHDALISVASILLTGIYGATDELHQYFVPYRSAEVSDVLCDFLGGFFGVCAYNLFLKKYPEIGCI
jgi:VanZ family protein